MQMERKKSSYSKLSTNLNGDAPPRPRHALCLASVVRRGTMDTVDRRAIRAAASLPSSSSILPVRATVVTEPEARALTTQVAASTDITLLFCRQIFIWCDYLMHPYFQRNALFRAGDIYFTLVIL